jgi:hypothetical protein
MDRPYAESRRSGTTRNIPDSTHGDAAMKTLNVRSKTRTAEDQKAIATSSPGFPNTLSYVNKQKEEKKAYSQNIVKVL